MPIDFAVSKCTLPTAGDVCFKLTGLKTFYVTSQPVYIWPGANPYQAIAQAGIGSVLSVRDPAEYILPLTPFDLTETDQLILNGVAYGNIPLPHIAMSQAQFDRQGADIARALNEWKQPGLVHCSSGDRGFGRLRLLSDQLLRFYAQAGAWFRRGPRVEECAIHPVSGKISRTELRRRRQSSLSGPPNNPNCAGSRAGSARPRCLNACEVNSRPRGVRCR